MNQTENVSILYTKKITHTWKKITAILYRSSAQLTGSENETVTASILRSSTNSSFKTYGLNPCKIPLKEFIFSKVAD